MNTKPTSSPKNESDVCIVGGAGHVGLPLGLAMADRGLRVTLFDLNRDALDTIGRGTMPFVEYGSEEVLQRVLNKNLHLSADRNAIRTARHVIITVGTPVDEYLNPRLRVVQELFKNLRPCLTPCQTIIIRSTVFPRTCEMIGAQLAEDGSGPWHVAYCPERIAQGYAIRELHQLPQLISGLTPKAVARAAELFSRIAPKVIPVTVAEAELAKLFSNSWRYIQFAAANQFYMMAQSFGVDFNHVRRAMIDGYGRASALPSAGLAAGPCLLKDTMQLAAFNNNNFMLGHAAMAINEGLPGFLVGQLQRNHDLAKTRVGILGMAFKADIDDTRDSLSYKLGKLLRFHGAQVFYSDQFAKDPTFISKEELVQRSDIVIIAAPHSAYKSLFIPPGTETVDIWGIVNKQTTILPQPNLATAA